MAPRERLAHYENNIVSDVSAFPAGPDYEGAEGNIDAEQDECSNETNYYTPPLCLPEYLIICVPLCQ